MNRRIRSIKPYIIGILLIIAITAPLIVQASYEEYYRARYRPLRAGTQIQVAWPSATANCSIGFPAYYDYYPSPDMHIRVYGIITASHCGNVGDEVYQNIVGENNYIGYFEKDGRWGRGGELRDSSASDSAFVSIGSEYCSPYCSPPSIFSNYIQHGGGLILLNSIVNNQNELMNVYTSHYVIYKGGGRTGLTSGYIMSCNGVVYRNDPIYGQIFYLSNNADHGDSGGIVYYRVGIGRDIENIGLGIVSARPSSGHCGYLLAVPVYHATDDLGVTVYTG